MNALNGILLFVGLPRWMYTHFKQRAAAVNVHCERHNGSWCEQPPVDFERCWSSGHGTTLVV